MRLSINSANDRLDDGLPRYRVKPTAIRCSMRRIDFSLDHASRPGQTVPTRTAWAARQREFAAGNAGRRCTIWSHRQWFVFLTTCHWFVVAFRLPKGMRFGSAAWEYVIATEHWAYLRRPGISNRFSCLWVIPSLKTFLVSGFASGASFLLAFAFNGFVNPAPL